MQTKKHSEIIESEAENLKLIFSENNFVMTFEVRVFGLKDKQSFKMSQGKLFF